MVRIIKSYISLSLCWINDIKINKQIRRFRVIVNGLKISRLNNLLVKENRFCKKNIKNLNEIKVGVIADNLHAFG